MKPSVVAIKQQEIFKFNAKAKSIPGVVNMTVGEPNFPTPEHIKKAAKDAIDDNETHYTVPEGIHELLHAVADYLHDKYDLNYDPETQIIASAGVTEGVFSAFNAILQDGDEVLIPSPSFTIYGPDADFNGAAPVYIDTSETDFKVTPEALKEAFRTNPRIKIFLLNFPSNPTGVSYTEDELRALADVLKQHDVFVISDEIYSELTYNFKHVSFGKILPEQTILLNGLSKSHAMTGWRFGIICGPAAVISQINKIHELATTSISSITQYAALEAYTNGYDDPISMRDQYKARRDVLHKGLNELGFDCPDPDGAFYLFAKIPDEYEQDDVKFANDLLEKEHLAILPGSFFGVGGKGHLRFSYAASMDNINTCVSKLGDFLKKPQKVANIEE
ncbi:aminotransferase class I/II-fold pyridoxal phosphate-dependent enzyme [Companilactobacillus halodurans]|uniref:Aminotransferase class I/II-fold pyridoxal phosphate-dependent enzyme n=1 Tax=Companilactobacillus halodurans TaxID=2584183 RepID=A0A5P0ZNT3_9LACO|nr:aminotransferase class I/II-fold pyridoxal phosphate-dependent enzyme [Companilactobacillus halodurans]MQS75893.1 aminotransferase class I/II-fold pyridoxal phosphate-dependent enzyme [Companilactobacillus halodurans]MQS98560.1 aminotransferase class I/II-fold pyridoxal phosphate-dependent enzyme [Companilactobacillus halodurans]